MKKTVMKKTILISALALAAAVFAGCTKDNLKVSPAQETGDVSGSKVCAYIEEVKAHLDGVNMTWSEGDRMKVLGYDEWLTPLHGGHLYELDAECAGKSKGTFSLVEGQTPAQSENVKKFFGIVNGGSTSFAGGGSESATNLLLTYMFPNNQNYVENGIEDNIMPLYAYGDALDNMKVYYCGSILSIKLYSKSDETIKIAKIELISSQFPCGYHYVSCYNYPENPCFGVVSGNVETVVTLNTVAEGVEISKESSSPTDFDIVLAPKNYNNIVVKIYDTEGGIMTLEKSVFNALAGTIYNMSAVEFEGKVEKSHLMLSIDGTEAQSIDDVVTIPYGTKEIKATLSDDKPFNDDDNKKLLSKTNALTNKIALDLSKINVPNNIMASQFKYYIKLKKLTLPESIRSWSGGGLFSTTLDTLVISNGIVTISNSAISTVTGVVYIPASVSSIEAGNHANVREFNVAAESKSFMSFNGVIFSKDGKSLVYYPAGNAATEYTIPETVNGGATNVVNTKANAFQYNKLTTIIVPSSIKSMSQPFSNVSSLSKIILEGDSTFITNITYSDAELDNLFHAYNGRVTCPSGSRQSYIDGTNGDGWKRLYELRNWTFDDGTSPM